MVVMEDVMEEERSAELYVSVHGGLDHTFLKRREGELSPFQTKSAKSYLMLPLSPQMFLVCVLWRLIFMLELPFQLKANLRAGLVTLEQYLASVGAISPATG